MRRSLLVTLLLFAPIFVNAATPVQDIVDEPIPIRADGSRFAIEDVRAAIIKGAQSRLWTATLAGDTSIHARLNVKNKHFAVVEVSFSEVAYSIKYVSSENLDYKAERGTIHRNYGKWVHQLSSMINQEFRKLDAELAAADYRRNEVSAARAEIFNELLKLDELRDRGILSDDEFEAEKKKLLERN